MWPLLRVFWLQLNLFQQLGGALAEVPSRELLFPGHCSQEDFFHCGEHPQQHSGQSDKALSGDKMTRYTTDTGLRWTAVRQHHKTPLQ